MRRISILTLHPQLIHEHCSCGVVGIAKKNSILEVEVINLRDYAIDRHGSIDGKPYGGGDGMVFRPEPIVNAIESFEGKPYVILTSPGGVVWSQKHAQRLLPETHCNLVIICGRFAGVDQRVIDNYVDEEVSVGDFILSGGELPALMMVDSMVRLLPGVLGSEDSAYYDSFSEGFSGRLEHPLYTRPRAFKGVDVPAVLLSGDHKKIEAWKTEKSFERTQKSRRDLLSSK